MTTDAMTVRGTVAWELLDAAGVVVDSGEVRNLVTAVGDIYYSQRAAGVAGAPSAITGMKLGTGSTAPSKTGAGAALVGYLANSHQALDANYPAVSSFTDSAGLVWARITYQATFPAGKATSGSAITEVVLVNTALADATSSAAATVARAVIVGITGKAAGETLVITWSHDFRG